MVDGQDLAKFWAVYQLHDRPHIRSLLEEYRIGTFGIRYLHICLLRNIGSGNLSACDYRRVKSETHFESYYKDDPRRPMGEVGQLRIPR